MNAPDAGGQAVLVPLPEPGSRTCYVRRQFRFHQKAPNHAHACPVVHESCRNQAGQRRRARGHAAAARRQPARRRHPSRHRACGKSPRGRAAGGAACAVCSGREGRCVAGHLLVDLGAGRAGRRRVAAARLYDRRGHGRRSGASRDANRRARDARDDARSNLPADRAQRRRRRASRS